MKISVLTENKALKKGFIPEHGLSLYIEHDGKKVLFDTGQTDIYIRNASLLGIDLAKTNYIVLSHGHYDHCGGLAFLPLPSDTNNKYKEIYIHKEAFHPKYSLNKSTGNKKYIGIPNAARKHLSVKDNLVLTQGCTSISRDIILAGDIPKTNEFENANTDYYCEKKGKVVPDVFNDEQMLIWKTQKGLAIFLGCSHPGIINCINYANTIFPDKKIHIVAAGMHLNNASDKYISDVVRNLKYFDIKNILPMHCAGCRATNKIKEKFAEKCKTVNTGEIVKI